MITAQLLDLTVVSSFLGIEPITLRTWISSPFIAFISFLLLSLHPEMQNPYTAEVQTMLWVLSRFLVKHLGYQKYFEELQCWECLLTSTESNSTWTYALEHDASDSEPGCVTERMTRVQLRRQACFSSDHCALQPPVPSCQHWRLLTVSWAGWGLQPRHRLLLEVGCCIPGTQRWKKPPLSVVKKRMSVLQASAWISETQDSQNWEWV